MLDQSLLGDIGSVRLRPRWNQTGVKTLIGYAFRDVDCQNAIGSIEGRMETDNWVELGDNSRSGTCWHVIRCSSTQKMGLKRKPGRTHHTLLLIHYYFKMWYFS